MSWGAPDVLVARLRRQGLLGGGPTSPLEAVRHSLAVQAQDSPFARWSLRLRTGASDAEVRAAIDDSSVVRTHLLRPTWHLVARSDLEWLQGLLGGRIEQGMAGRHRQLGLVDQALPRGLQALAAALDGPPRTRRQLMPDLVAAGVQDDGSVVGHLLLVAELRGLITSAGLDGEDQRYRWIAPSAQGVQGLRAESDAQTQSWTDALVLRFVASHGPVSVRDVTRWAALPQGQVRASLARQPQLEPIEVDGVQLCHLPDPANPIDATDPRGVFVLPVFDEAFLSYRDVVFPRAEAHPAVDSPYRFAESSTGVVLWNLTDVGTWRRRKRGATASTSVDLAPGLPDSVRREIDRQLGDVATHGLPTG